MKSEAQVYARKLRDERPARPFNPDEYMALRKLRVESHAQGAVLANSGRGGLPSSLVLGVMRRDGYRCVKCSSADRLTVHHIGGVDNPSSDFAQRMGKRNTPENLAVVCEPCHDQIHESEEVVSVE